MPGLRFFHAAAVRHRPAITACAALFLAAASLLPGASLAQATLPAITAIQNANGGQTYSLSVQTLLLLTSLSFLPAVLLMMTGFTRIIIVLGLLRNALGTPTSPPNSVLIGLALFLTFFAMSPVFDQIYSQAYQPLSAGAITFETALERGVKPLKTFMLHQTREADLSMFAGMANTGPLATPDAVPLRVLVPAFVTSELKSAFQIGFTIFIPFLIIDLVVASVLMALGMMMVPPVTISLPFKLMLFVLADGWHLLLGSLARSFYQ
jgi:flagellar biosynthetic protein FliP